jgi:hypothetical protein
MTSSGYPGGTPVMTGASLAPGAAPSPISAFGPSAMPSAAPIDIFGAMGPASAPRPAIGLSPRSTTVGPSEQSGVHPKALISTATFVALAVGVVVL